MSAHRTLGRFWTLTQRSVEAFFSDHCPQLAASVSYYALLSIFPAAIVIAAVIGHLLGAGDRHDVTDFLLQNLPLSPGDGRHEIQQVLRGVAGNSAALGLVGLVGLLYTASALLGSLRNSLNIIWGVHETRPPVRAKLFDIAMFAGLAVLGVASLGLTILRDFAVRLGGELGVPGNVIDWLLGTAGALIPIVISVAIVTILLRVLPAVTTRFRDLWPGILVGTVGYELTKRGFGLYISQFGHYSLIYGALGAVVVFMIFVYLAAISFLLGAEFAELWPRVRAGEFDSEDGEPVPKQVLGLLRSLVMREREREERDQPRPRHPRHPYRV